ncbi:MAG: MFS transporter [Alphaproteobacteria bacterium]|nr:MFS transporter [Alphaproteobacteria bacterium]
MSHTGNWGRFVVIGLGTLIAPLDSSVNIAFPDITQGFALALPSIQWVVICFVLTYGSLMLVFGRLGDLFGHLRIFQIGLALGAAGLVLCATATRYEWLLVFRVVQGIGTAMVISCGPALATSLFDEAMRPRVLGAYMTIFGLGGVIGPSLGGVLVEAWGWPAVFWFRLPIALGALLLSFALALPPRPRAAGGFDLSGAILLVLSLSLLLLTVSQMRNPDVGATAVAGLVAGTIVAFALFVLRERSAAAPIIELGVFGNLDFALVNVANIAVNLAGFSVLLLVPYFLVRATGLPLSLGGMVLATSSLGMIVAALLGGHLAHRIGANRIAFAGATVIIVGLAAIGYWPAEAPVAAMVAALLVHGLGLGLFQVSCLELVTATLPRVDRGVAGSLVLVTRTIGVVLAAGLLTLMFTAIEGVATAEGATNPFLAGFQSTFRYTALGLAGFIALTCLRPRIWFGGRV